MPTTTIKVDTAVRDRLALLAQERGTTMGNLLAEITERLERQAFFARAREQLERLRDADPGEWERNAAESRIWHEGTDRDALSLDDEPGWWE
jgi:predicted DNA-binding protein